MYFELLKKEQVGMVLEWFKQEHVAQFWNGVGLQNTLKSIETFVSGKETSFHIWIAYEQQIPFAYLKTARIDLEKDPLYAQYCDVEAIAITLDLFIGDTRYLGKGLAHIMIQELLQQKFLHASDIFIDPAVDNPRAIHVYEKAGFKKLEEFIPEWDPTTRCLLMRMKREPIINWVLIKHR